MTRPRGPMKGRAWRWAARRVERPASYSRLQRFVGWSRVWERFVAEVVRAHPGARVLDVGCGPADVLLFLPEGVHYEGIDTSRDYIEGAARRHGVRGMFRVAQVQGETPTEPYDLVLVLGLLHHLDDAVAVEVLRAAAALAPNGRVLSLDGCRGATSTGLRGFFYDVDRGQHVRDQAGYEALARRAGLVPHSQRWAGMLRVPYTLLVMEMRGGDVPAGRG
jgi:SAM-dependent methyltransferase